MTDTQPRLGTALPVDPVHLDWVKANEVEKKAIIIENIRILDDGLLKGLSIEEQSKFIDICWKTCCRLQINDRQSASFFCYYSLVWGMYFYEDPRWGYNSKIMEDVSTPAIIRLQRVYAEIAPLFFACYGSDFSRVTELNYRFIKIDMAAALPLDIKDQVKLLKAIFKLYWPQRLLYLPPLYFENTVIFMTRQCRALELYNEWDTLLASGLALIIGRFFFQDPAFSWVSQAFLAKDSLVGRDKTIKILRIVQSVVKRNMAGEN